MSFEYQQGSQRYNCLGMLYTIANYWQKFASFEYQPGNQRYDRLNYCPSMSNVTQLIWQNGNPLIFFWTMQRGFWVHVQADKLLSSGDQQPTPWCHLCLELWSNIYFVAWARRQWKLFHQHAQPYLVTSCFCANIEHQITESLDNCAMHVRYMERV